MEMLNAAADWTPPALLGHPGSRMGFGSIDPGFTSDGAPVPDTNPDCFLYDWSRSEKTGSACLFHLDLPHVQFLTSSS